MKYILAHDLGTSGNKATLFSDEGKMITSEVFRYDCHYFNTNWAEQDPEDFWKAICVTSRNLIDKARIDPGDIAAVSFSGQMMGCLCVDKQGNPLRPSIIWADQRAQAQAAALGEQISLRDFYHIAGHRNSASYGLQKLMWVRDNEPGVYAKTYKALNAKDFIVLRLTGKFYTEPSDATSNACIDLNTLQWSDKIVNASGIDGDKLPEIVPSTTVAGEVTPWAAGQTGLKAGTPVVMGGGDGLCSNVGAGSISPGRTFSCIGTSAWVATTSEKPLFDEEMRTFTWAHIVPGLYSPTGTMQAGGSSYNWLKGQVAKYETAVAKVQGISPYDLINAEAAKSPVGANGVLFLPYLLAVAVYYVYFVSHGYFSFSLRDLAGYMIRGDLSSPFYFVIALAQFVLLVPLFRWLPRRWSPSVLLPISLGITWLSALYCNEILGLLIPGAHFSYNDRLFTTYLVYYVGGCCAGQNYPRFLELLDRNRHLLTACALIFAGADLCFSWKFFVGGQSVPFLEMIHTLYQLTAIPALYALVVRHPVTLSPLARRMDRASFLVYLYHSLVITWFNDLAWQLGISRVSVQFLLRVVTVYTLTFLGAMAWQWMLSRARRPIPLKI